MSEEALTAVLFGLRRSLKGDPAERARLWGAKAGPWLAEYWPQAAARNTSATTVAMLDMLVESGDAFPEAVAWALRYLQPTGGNGLYHLRENRLAGQYPNPVLEILDVVVRPDGVPARQRHSLHEILDSLKQVRELRADPRFQRLHRIANA